MSVTVDWMDNRYSLIHANFVAQWNWSELYSALTRTHMLTSHSHRPITLLLDFIGSTKASATSTLFTIADHVDDPESVTKIIIITDEAELGEKLHGVLGDIFPDVKQILLTHSHQEAFEKVRKTVEISAVK